ncbi:MAG: hypothetical protein LAT64_11200 [Phycisphaerales bacterium]|nr:hypothetical protein [Planctomycetota bacterium]MCH8509317.1 hypothetical protein [Phycisphaerales bacterium]
MTAHWFLILLLLIHPLRGVVMLSPEPSRFVSQQTASCPLAGDCCPLCSAFDACPCTINDPGPDRDPAPAVPPTKSDLPRPVGVSAGPVWREALTPVTLLRDAAPRAPPSHAAPVGDFLSVVCVWTT